MGIMLFGHRGAAGEAPENTLVGFAHAFQVAHVRCFEFDVHLTKDRQLAIIHDASIDRTTNGKGFVADYTLQELKKLDAGVLYKPQFAGAVIPSLDEFLAIYASKITSFQLEIKTDTHEVLDIVAKMVVEALENYEIADKTVVTSFDPYAIEQVLKIRPSQKCGFIAMEYKLEDLETALRLGCFNTCIRITTPNGKELVAHARAKGLQTTGWLGNSTQDVNTLLDWHVDSITTNYPTSIGTYLRDVRQLRII